MQHRLVEHPQHLDLPWRFGFFAGAFLLICLTKSKKIYEGERKNREIQKTTLTTAQTNKRQ